MGEAKTIEEFGDLVINQRGGQPNYNLIHLKQVARIEEGMADALRISRAMGTPGVALNILKQRGTNAVAVAKAVRAKVAEIQKGLPEGMKLSVNFDSTRYIEQAVGELELHPGALGAPDRSGLLDVPGLLVLDLQRAPGDPDLGRRHLHRALLLRVHPEHLHPAGLESLHRHRGRRRHHGAGKHHAPPGKGRRTGSWRPWPGPRKSPSPPWPPPSPSSRSSCRWPS